MSKLLEIIIELKTGIKWIEKWSGEAYQTGDEVDLGLTKIKEQIKELVKLEIGGGAK